MYVNTDSDWDGARVRWIYRGAITAMVLAALVVTLCHMTGVLGLRASVALCVLAGLPVAVIPPWFTGEMDVWQRDWGREGVHASVVANIVVSVICWPLVAVSLIFAFEPVLVTLGMEPVFTLAERGIAAVLWAVVLGLGLVERWVQSHRY